MLSSSLPIGTYLGVEVRVHSSFPLLLLVALSLSVYFTGGIARGLALWLSLGVAVLIREVARSIASAYAGLHLRAIYLLPVGGVMAFSSADGATLQSRHPSRRRTRWVTLSGPVANFAVGVFLLVFSFGVDPHVSLLAQPWISLGHILRSNVWTELVLGGVSLLPAATMPTRHLLRSTPQDKLGGQAAAGKPVFSPGTGAAIAMLVAGFLMPNFYWLIVVAGFVLLYVHVNTVHAQAGEDTDAILVREVMLTEYTLLSSSETLRGALDRSVHSLHEVFPVLRGERLVGAIARPTIAQRLSTGGDSYLQGAMTRTLQIATPDEKLVDALRRGSDRGASEFIPVVEGDRLIGILSPQSLGRAVHQVKMLRPIGPQPNA